MPTTEETIAAFDWFADWAEGTVPLYHRLAQAVVEDERLLDMAGEAAEGQPPPNLLFAAVHSLLLDGVDHDLRQFYASCTTDSIDPADQDPFPPFRDFCLEHEESIRELVGSRRVQTNAVGRSAILFPSFRHVVDEPTESLGLVEIGTSAGLNLAWDRFRYEYGGLGTYGNPGSPVTIETAVQGEREPPLWEHQPRVTHRVGIDVNPLDVTDPEDAQWLRALVMPDQEWRFDRLDAALTHVADDPPTVREGDALEVLPEMLGAVPADVTCCVFSTLVLYQLDDGDVDRLRAILREASAERPIHWLSDDLTTDEHKAYRHAVLQDGTIEAHHLANYKSHGEWIEWVGGTCPTE